MPRLLLAQVREEFLKLGHIRLFRPFGVEIAGLRFSRYRYIERLEGSRLFIHLESTDLGLLYPLVLRRESFSDQPLEPGFELDPMTFLVRGKLGEFLYPFSILDLFRDTTVEISRTNLPVYRHFYRFSQFGILPAQGSLSFRFYHDNRNLVLERFPAQEFIGPFEDRLDYLPWGPLRILL